MKKKIVSALLTAAMVCGMSVVPAMAAEIVSTERGPEGVLYTYSDGTGEYTEYCSEMEYPMTALVVDTDVSANIVYISCANGNVFSFTGVEDWQIGDLCTCIMYMIGTDTVHDDIVKTATYAGHIDQFIEILEGREER